MCPSTPPVYFSTCAIFVPPLTKWTVISFVPAALRGRLRSIAHLNRLFSRDANAAALASLLHALLVLQCKAIVAPNSHFVKWWSKLYHFPSGKMVTCKGTPLDPREQSKGDRSLPALISLALSGLCPAAAAAPHSPRGKATALHLPGAAAPATLFIQALLRSLSLRR